MPGQSSGMAGYRIQDTGYEIQDTGYSGRGLLRLLPALPTCPGRMGDGGRGTPPRSRSSTREFRFHLLVRQASASSFLRQVSSIALPSPRSYIPPLRIPLPLDPGSVLLSLSLLPSPLTSRTIPRHSLAIPLPDGLVTQPTFLSQPSPGLARSLSSRSVHFGQRRDGPYHRVVLAELLRVTHPVQCPSLATHSPTAPSPTLVTMNTWETAAYQVPTAPFLL
jgi:hypothetical protein